MKRILIAFGSSTGNTGRVSEIISEVLKKKGFSTELKNISYIKPEETAYYDVILLECSTWGIEEIELQSDFIPFFEKMEKQNFTDKKTAVFGRGDLDYKFFCGAVDLIEDKLQYFDSKLLNSSLKIHGDPEENIKEITKWAEDTASNILK